MSRLTYNFKDSKGHPLKTVWARDDSKTGPTRIPYLYCHKCDKFSKINKEIVIL